MPLPATDATRSDIDIDIDIILIYIVLTLPEHLPSNMPQ